MLSRRFFSNAIAVYKSTKIYKNKIILGSFIILSFVSLPVILSQLGKSQDNRQRAVSENAPSITPRVAVIMMYFDYPSPKPPLTPLPTKVPPLTPYPTFPTDTPPVTPYPTFPPLDPRTNSVLTVALLKNLLEVKGYYGEPSVNSFYNDVTSGKVQFQFDYFDWTPMNQEPPPNCGDLYALMDTSNSIMKSKGIDLNPYQMRMYVYSPLSGCGLSFGGKQPDKEYSFAIMNNSVSTISYSHELGHALKLGHANYLDCKNDNDYTNNCTNVEYGDPYDIMGGSGYFNAPHQISLGLLLPDQIKEVTESGIYSIVPLNLKTDKIQALKILKKDENITDCYEDSTECKDKSVYYYIEYRRIVGADDHNTYNIPDKTEGLIIHKWGNVISEYMPTYLLNKDSKKLQDGETFYDSINNIKITMVSHDENQAIVNVQTGTDSLTPIPNKYSLTIDQPDLITIPVNGRIQLNTTLLENGIPIKDKSDIGYRWIYNPGIVDLGYCVISQIVPCPFDETTITGLMPGKQIVTVTALIKSSNKDIASKKFTVFVDGALPTKIPPLFSPTPIPTIVIPTGPTGEQHVFFRTELPGIGKSTSNMDLNQNPIHKQRTAIVQLINSNNQTVSTGKGIMNFIEDGIYKYAGKIGVGILGNTIQPGLYTAKIKFENTLFKNVPGIIKITSDTALVETQNVNLVSGDLNQDNSLSIIDWTNMISCVKVLPSCTADLKVLADLNDDGYVDKLDVQILQRGFANRIGD